MVKNQNNKTKKPKDTKKKDVTKNDVNTSSKFLYVGIGASAGGLDALKKLLSNVPEKSGMAFLIVQHMDPVHKSGLPNILSRYTSMDVVQAADDVEVVPNNVYVIPPNKDMAVLNGKIQLMEPEEPHGLRMPINYFLTSLAQDQQENSVGIILSGFGSDGSIGLRAIKAKGGISIAQDPSTAGSEGMPTSAINTGVVDIVLSPEEMPEKLISYVKSSRKILKKIFKPEDETVHALRKIILLVRNRTGQDFSQYKKSTVYRRIGRRMNIHQIEEMTQYLQYLQENPHEVDLLFNEFLINVTNFFRDPDAFDALKEGALKNLIIEKNELDDLRVWVPGCSSGEEVYSIAILIKELMDELNTKLEVQIFGTDLDVNSIKTARTGTYPGIALDLSPERLHKYFYKKENLYTIKNDIRNMVVFANHNVITDPPFTKLDMISCRNLLIYLETEAQEKVLSNFNYALKKDGILFLGPSESIGEFIDTFSVVDNKWKIFKCVKSNGFVYDFVKNHPVSFQPTSYWGADFDLKDTKAEKLGLNVTALAEKKLISIYAPPSALINESGEILYIHGRLGRYLEPSPGKAHMNILEMAREGIKLSLNSAVQNAISNKKEVVFEGLKVVDAEGNNHFMRLAVKPIKDPHSIEGLLIVSFEESPENEKAEKDQIKMDPLSKSSEHIQALENELKMTKERLNITIEEMTTSNEELKSANEELQSMNEEAQSTNEELETSKEELQSINEELTTINSELQMKIDELSRTNDDMTNLFNSTEIATIFVDNDLNIRRFTDEATKLINLIESDVGRPLSDIVSRVNYPDLVDDIKEVIEKVAFKETVVNNGDDEWYKVRIMPYKTSQNVIDGATVTFIDVSHLKVTQEKMQSALTYAEDILDSVSEPLLVIGYDLKVTSVNSAYNEKFNIKKSKIEGENIQNLDVDLCGIPEFKNQINKILHGDINEFVLEHKLQLMDKKMLVNVRKIHRLDTDAESIIIVFEEV